MKKYTVNTIKSSFTDLLVLLNGLSRSNDFHGSMEVLVQSEDTGFVNYYVFDKDKTVSECHVELNRLENFIEINSRKIGSVRFKFDLVVFDK